MGPTFIVQILDAMKTLAIIAALAICGICSAQQTGQPDQDKIQQEPPRETQRVIERASKTDAIQRKAESEFQAEKQAKDKGRTQKQTTAEPAVSDTVRRVKDPKFQIQDIDPKS